MSISPSLVQFGLGIVSGAIQGGLQSSLSKAQATVDNANTAASNLIREGNNEIAAARTALDNVAKSINNKRAMSAGGDRVNEIATNYYRMLDQASKGEIQQQLAASEQVGRLAAAAGWAGIGGSTNDLIEQTMRRRDAMASADRADILQQQAVDFQYQTAQAQNAIADSVDYRYSLAGMDYGTSQSPYRGVSETAFSGAIAGMDLSLLKDGLAGLKGNNTDTAKSLGLTHTTTPVTSPSFSDSVATDFFSLGMGGAAPQI